MARRRRQFLGVPDPASNQKRRDVGLDYFVSPPAALDAEELAVNQLAAFFFARVDREKLLGGGHC